MTTLPQTSPTRTPRIPTNGQGHPGQVLSAGQAPGDTGMTPADILRVIRSNAWLILIALVLSAGIGYGANYLFAKYHSRYRSTGLVNVKVDKTNVLDGSVASFGSNDSLDVDQNTQMKLITADRNISEVMVESDDLRQTEWFKQFIINRGGQQIPDMESARSDLQDRLDVIVIPSSRLLQVAFTCASPKDAQTIVTEIVKHHIQKIREQDNASNMERAVGLENLKTNYEGQIRDKQARMQKLREELGSEGVGIGAASNSTEYEFQSLISEQLRAMAYLGAAKAKRDTFEKQMETNSAPELEQALQGSQLYSEYRRAVDDLQMAYDDLVQSLGKDHPQSIKLKRRLDQMQRQKTDSENDIKARTAELIRANLQQDLLASEAAIERVNKRIDGLRGEIAAMAQKKNSYETLSQEVRVIQGQLDSIKDKQDKLGVTFSDEKWSRVAWATMPDLPDRPVFPRLVIIMPLAIMLGLALSLGIAFLRELTDTTIRSPRDISRIGQLTLLGVIPHESDDPQAAGSRLPLAIFEAPHSIIAEQFRQVRTRLQHTTSLDTTRSILVTGCSPEDGKTTVACNLAAGLALNGRRILLVDANFRRPNLHNIFEPSSQIGFGDALNDLDLFEDAIQETEVPNLSVVIAGTKPSNPTELLESQLLVDFIERALEEYDHVIFDSGPLLMVSDSIALAPRVDGVVTVVRAQGNSRGMLTRMRDELRRLKAEHLGVVLNAVRVHGGGYYNSMIKNYYAYQNG